MNSSSISGFSGNAAEVSGDAVAKTDNFLLGERDAAEIRWLEVVAESSGGRSDTTEKLVAAILHQRMACRHACNTIFRDRPFLFFKYFLHLWLQNISIFLVTFYFYFFIS